MLVCYTFKMEILTFYIFNGAIFKHLTSYKIDIMLDVYKSNSCRIICFQASERLLSILYVQHSVPFLVLKIAETASNRYLN